MTADGWPVWLPEDGSDRAVTVIESDAGPVAALVHDAGLNEQRAFLEAVGGFALVGTRTSASPSASTRPTTSCRSPGTHPRGGRQQRRRIERDLHDGGQQRLVALRIRLQLAEEMMVKSPAGAREMLQRLARDVDGVLEELRSLAAGVYPAALAAHGLPDAVRAVATESPLPVHVKVNGSERYPDEVEAAVYFCCLEAMQNVAKHAPGSTRIWVVLELGSDLRFEVRDDGPGFDVEATSGAGSTTCATASPRWAGGSSSSQLPAAGPGSAAGFRSSPRTHATAAAGRTGPNSCLRTSTAAPDALTARCVAALSSTDEHDDTSGCRSRMCRAVASPSMSGCGRRAGRARDAARRRPRARPAGRRPAEPAEAGGGGDDLVNDVEEEGLVAHRDTDLLVCWRPWRPISPPGRDYAGVRQRLDEPLRRALATQVRGDPVDVGHSARRG